MIDEIYYVVSVCDLMRYAHVGFRHDCAQCGCRGEGEMETTNLVACTVCQNRLIQGLRVATSPHTTILDVMMPVVPI